MQASSLYQWLYHVFVKKMSAIKLKVIVPENQFRQVDSMIGRNRRVKCLVQSSSQSFQTFIMVPLLSFGTRVYYPSAHANVTPV